MVAGFVVADVPLNAFYRGENRAGLVVSGITDADGHDLLAPQPLWEWDRARDAHGGSAGLSDTRHGAMEALARALIQAGRPGRGRVAAVTLSRPVHEPAYYVRLAPEQTAVYDGEVIQWR